MIHIHIAHQNPKVPLCCTLHDIRDETIRNIQRLKNYHPLDTTYTPTTNNDGAVSVNTQLTNTPYNGVYLRNVSQQYLSRTYFLTQLRIYMYQSGCTIWTAHVNNTVIDEVSATIEQASEKVYEDHNDAIINAREIDVKEAHVIRQKEKRGIATQIDCHALEKFEIRQMYGLTNDMIIDIEFMKTYGQQYQRDQYRNLQEALHGGTDVMQQRILDEHTRPICGEPVTMQPIVSSFAAVSNSSTMNPSRPGIEYIEHLVEPFLLHHETDMLLHGMGFPPLKQHKNNTSITVYKSGILETIELRRDKWLRSLNGCNAWKHWCNGHRNGFNPFTAASTVVLKQFIGCIRSHLNAHFNIKCRQKRSTKKKVEIVQYHIDFSYWKPIEQKTTHTQTNTCWSNTLPAPPSLSAACIARINLAKHSIVEHQDKWKFVETCFQCSSGKYMHSFTGSVIAHCVEENAPLYRLDVGIHHNNVLAADVEVIHIVTADVKTEGIITTKRLIQIQADDILKCINIGQWEVECKHQPRRQCVPCCRRMKPCSKCTNVPKDHESNHASHLLCKHCTDSYL
jgi:hypothetical protein